MKKTVALYWSCPRIPIAERAIEHIHQGLEALGVGHVVRETKQYEPTDLAVVPGWIKKRVEAPGGRGDVIRGQQERGLHLMILERAFIVDREFYHSLPWDGFSGRGDHRNKGMPPDRWNKMGLELKPYREDGNHILLCGQVPWDSQVDASEHVKWLYNTIDGIRSNTDRPILFRMHPKVRKIIEKVKYKNKDVYDTAKMRRMGVKISNGTLDRDLSRAWAMVCYNSNAAVEATIAGVPCFTFDRYSMAWDVTDHDLAKIDHPTMFEREQWAYNLAYAQWSNAELKSGEAWLHLTRGTPFAPRKIPDPA